MKSRSTRLALVLLALLAFTASTSADDECNIYPYVTATYLPGFGYYCGGYGLNCTECYNTGTGKYCVRNGNQPCQPILIYE